MSKESGESRVIKAGIGYTVGNYLLKGLSFLTVPVFSRLLSPAENGIFNTYLAYQTILFLLVGMANILDVAVIGNGSVLRTAVIFFYISNEGVSLLENARHLGLPIPQKMKDVLEQLHDRGEGSEGE